LVHRHVALDADAGARRARLRQNAWAELKFATHAPEFPGLSLQQYIDRAERLANAPVGGSILEHQGSDLTIVHFDKATGEFLIADSTNGEIVTFFKPKNGLQYYLNDITGR
jgi:hypothetical protein